jgi:gas vesicle protein
MSNDDKSSKRSKSIKSSGFWLILLGAMGGILLAPTSGRETRQTIANEVDHGRKSLLSLSRDTSQEMGRIAESARRIARRVTHL